MHIFIVDLFISLDNQAPIIHALNKKTIKTKIYFVNPLQDFSNNKLIKFLDSNEYHENGVFCV